MYVIVITTEFLSDKDTRQNLVEGQLYIACRMKGEKISLKSDPLVTKHSAGPPPLQPGLLAVTRHWDSEGVAGAVGLYYPGTPSLFLA